MNKLGVVSAGVIRRSRVVAVFLLAALVLGSAVSASTGGRYKGKTKQGLSVAFRVSGSSLTGFVLSGSAICISASKSATEIYPVKAPKAGKLSAGGGFTISYVKNTTHATITGKVSGSSASGRINLHYTKLWQAPTLETATCWVKTTWSARRTG